jgi:hypothetical protein
MVFHQDLRLLNQGNRIVGEGVVYFYSNGSAVANRGAEVIKRREFTPLSSLSNSTLASGHSSAASRSS